MARDVLTEEFHLSVSAPRGLPETDYDTIRQTLDRDTFRVGLRRAIRALVRKHPSLSKAHVKITR